MPNLLEGLITRQDIADIAESENLILDDEDRMSILESMDSMDVQACPGSGKTTLIAAKLILLAKKWPFQDQGICVLSHTNVAKNEIVDRLKKSKTIAGQRLLSYPHFIGTIQEFVGKYVAFPLIRSNGTKIKMVDTENCVNLIYANIRPGTRTYIDSKSQFSNVLFDFNLNINGTSISVNVPTFPNGSNSLSYKNLKAVRERMIAEGHFFYRDIYIYAKKALAGNQGVGQALRGRFPCIFIDEMQDTQKYQDELLLQIFPLNEPRLTIQRFGDPDQAIFHGIAGEEPNASFNGKSAANMDSVINKSHRFDEGIAAKIKRLSFNEVLLETEITGDNLEARKLLHANRQNFEHTVIIYRDENIGTVIPIFAEIVSSQFSKRRKQSSEFSVKVVGAVGNEIDPNENQLKIGHYWPEFDKAKSKPSFKEKTLIEAVHYCRQTPSCDWAANYKLLIDCILKFLRSTDKRDPEGKYFGATSMGDFLKAKGEWKNFRELIHLMLSDEYWVDQQFWDNAKHVLFTIFDLNGVPDEVNDYLAFHNAEENVANVSDADEPDEVSLISMPENMIRHPDGFKVELSTIHGVKGETHDATLVLDTKNHCCDLETMMPYLTGDLPSDQHTNGALRAKPSSQAAFKPNQRFLRQFYVAMSRPKHLLCLAVHSNRITAEQKIALDCLGWQLRELP